METYDQSAYLQEKYRRNTNIVKDLRANPANLYNKNICNTKTKTYEYTTIPGLSEYQEVDVYYRIGDCQVSTVRVNRNGNTSFAFSAYSSATYNGCIFVHVDFENNRIGIQTYIIAGWGYEFLSVTRVTGILKL